ncbi:MAG: caspase family protein, partial [Pyrinomonadaceae bacterium]
HTLKGHSGYVTSVAFSPDQRTLASASPDASVKLWNVAGEELSNLVALDKDDWAVITTSGLFDATPGARKLMHYVVAMEVVTLEQMKNLYYLPGLLQKVMRGDSLPKLPLFTAQELFPDAEYQQLQPGQKTFIVKLRNRGGGIGPVQVLVNGTEVIADARPTGLDPQAKEATLTIDLTNVKQLVPGQENKLEVIASNVRESLNSKNSARGVKVVFVGEGPALAEPTQLYAIIGGVSKFLDDQLNLRYSAKDARDFARALEIGAAKFLGRDKVHIRLLAGDKTENKTLTGADSSELTPSKENFRKVFAEYAAKAKPNDILVVYLSGHGVALKDKSYLYLIQEAYTTDIAVLAEDNI